MPAQEALQHSHVPEERAHLFLSENGGTIEDEYRALILAAIEATKPTRVLEIGSGAATPLWHRLASRLGASFMAVEPHSDYAESCRKQGILVWPGQLKDMPLSKPEPWDFIILDSSLNRRAEELDLLYTKGVAGPRTLIVIHDTSRLRTMSGIRCQESIAFWAAFPGVVQKHSLQVIEFPLSRGLLFVQQTTPTSA